MKLTIKEHDNGCFRVGTNVIFDDEFIVTDYGNKLKKYFDSLTESSLKRVEKHESEDSGMIMISASRSFLNCLDALIDEFPECAERISNTDVDDKKLPVDKIALQCYREYLNKKNKSLEKDIANLGLGFIRTVGGYKESGGLDVEEMSFLVPYAKTNMTETEFVDEFLKLCDKYDQDSILVKYQEDKHLYYIDRNGNEEMAFDTFRYNDMALYFSYLLKGRDRGKKWEYIKTESASKNSSVYDYLCTFSPDNVVQRVLMDKRKEIFLRMY